MYKDNGKMICAGCFNETEDENICFHCGRNLNENTPEIALKKGTVLKERYIVGRLNIYDDLINRYTAYDRLTEKIVLVTEYMPKMIASRNKSASELNIANESCFANYNNGLQVFSSSATYFKETTQRGLQKCLDVFYENFTAYAVFEKIDGQSLGVSMRNFNNDSSLVINVMKPLLVGLEELHRKGFNFGQISPMKIVFRNGNSADPVLCDADLYSHVDLNMDTYCFTGKLSAFSPIEAYMSKYVKSNSNDIYSLCLSLYSCFDERIAANIEENKIVDKELIIRKGFSPKMANIFAKACSDNFNDRYLNAFEIMCDIGLRKRETVQKKKKKDDKKAIKIVLMAVAGFFMIILILLIILFIRFCGGPLVGTGATDGQGKTETSITSESGQGETVGNVSDNIVSENVNEDTKPNVQDTVADDDTDKIGGEEIIDNVVSIQIEQKPNKLDYKVGEKLSLTGLEVKVVYDNGESEILKDGFTTDPKDGSTLTESRDVYVSYGGQTTFFRVSVSLDN